MSDLFYFVPDPLGFPQWETDKALVWLRKNAGKRCWADMGRETGVRTLKQNDSLHLWFEMVAKELNASGQTLQKILEQSIEVEWNKNLVKELIWRPVQKMISQKSSTTRLDKTTEIDMIYEHLNRFLGEKCLIHVPFPSQEKPT